MGHVMCRHCCVKGTEPYPIVTLKVAVIVRPLVDDWLRLYAALAVQQVRVRL